MSSQVNLTTIDDTYSLLFSNKVRRLCSKVFKWASVKLSFDVGGGGADESTWFSFTYSDILYRF